MLKIDIQVTEPGLTLFCSGRIVLGLEAEALRCMVVSRLEQQLVLDLWNVEVIDAAGLGLLVELHCLSLQRNAKLMIANPSRHVRRLFAVTGLQPVLGVTDEAVDHELKRKVLAGQAMTA